MLCALGMVNFQALLQDTPLPDKRLRTRATLLFQSLLQGQTANSLGMLSPADRTQESFTRGAYRFFDHEQVTLPALHSPMQAALKQLVCPDRRAYVAHDVSVLNYSGHERKEDLISVGNDHTWGYELFQSLVIQGGRPLGAAFTELHHSHGLLSSQSADILPFTDHLEQTERAIDAIEKLLPGCQLVHLCDREFDDLQLLRHLGLAEDAVTAWARTTIEEGLGAFAALLPPPAGPFCFGDAPGLADIFLVPQLVNARRFGAQIAAPRILEIEQACLALDAFKRSVPEAQPDAE